MTLQYLNLPDTDDATSITIAMWVYVPAASLEAAETSQSIPFFAFGPQPPFFGVSVDGSTSPFDGPVTLIAQTNLTNGSFGGDAVCGTWSGVPSPNFDSESFSPNPGGSYGHSSSPGINTTASISGGNPPFPGLSVSLDCSGVRFTRNGEISSPDQVTVDPELLLGGFFTQDASISMTNTERNNPYAPSVLFMNTAGDVFFDAVPLTKDARTLGAIGVKGQFTFTGKMRFGTSGGIVANTWNHIFFSWDGPNRQADTWSFVVNGGDRADHSLYDNGFVFPSKMPVKGFNAGFPAVPDQIGIWSLSDVIPGPSQLLRFAYVQVWFNQFIDASPSNLDKFFVLNQTGSRIIPPPDLFAAQDAFGRSEIFCLRDKNKKIPWANYGSAGELTVVGTDPTDYRPGPGQ